MYDYRLQQRYTLRQPVTSSNLHSVGYDPASRTLEVELSSRTILPTSTQMCLQQFTQN